MFFVSKGNLFDVYSWPYGEVPLYAWPLLTEIATTYWLTAVLAADKGRGVGVGVGGECFYFLCFFTFIHFTLSSLSLSLISSIISSISLLHFSERRHKLTHKGWRVVKPHYNQSMQQRITGLKYGPWRSRTLTAGAVGSQIHYKQYVFVSYCQQFMFTRTIFQQHLIHQIWSAQ